jgi:hypothetical protein
VGKREREKVHRELEREREREEKCPEVIGMQI